MSADLIRQIDEALATLAIAIRAHGEHGIRIGMPFFERLERERAMLASIDERLDRAIARVRERPSRSPRATRSGPRNSHSAAE